MKKKLAKKLSLGGYLSGGLSGALTGGGLGAAFGGIGAPIGAIVGFAGGLFSHNKQKKADRAREEEVANATDMYLTNLDSLKNEKREQLYQFRADQESKATRYQLAHNESILRNQDIMDSMVDESNFRDYAGGRGRGFGTNSFFKMGGNMKLAKPDILGVRQDPTRGGYIDNSASNAGIVHGRPHESGGVKLPGAEVEGGESVVQSPYTGQTQVHSDEMGTSDISNELIARKGEIEDKLNRLNDEMEVIEFNLNSETTTIRRNSYQRQYDAINSDIQNLQQEIQQIDSQIEQMYQAQEGVKADMGMQQGGQAQPMGEQFMKLGGILESLKFRGLDKPKIGLAEMNIPTSSSNRQTAFSRFMSNVGNVKGNKFGQALEFAAPFIDNIFNVRQTNRLRDMELPSPSPVEPTLYGDPVLHSTPTELSPILDKPTRLDPTYDVSSQMSQVERDVAGTTNRVMSNVSDSRIGRALATNIGMQGTQMKGAITTEKLNQERAGRNANRQINQEVSMRNTERINQYNALNADRRDRVQMANVDLTNAYARGDIDLINQYDMMNNEAQYRHALAKFDKDVMTNITMPSQNVAQMRDEIIGILDRRDMRSYQDKQIALQQLLGRGTGIAERNWADILGKDVWERIKKEYNIKE